MYGVSSKKNIAFLKWLGVEIPLQTEKRLVNKDSKVKGKKIRDLDFPVIEPISAQDLIEQGLGLLNVDRGMFEHKLNTVVELVVPHRMNLTDDPYEVHKKWIAKRTNMVAERLVFSINNDWLARALDPQAPDSTRWWLSIALLNGLSIGPLGQPIHQGYHLLESIAIGERPGTWHTQPEAGPQNLDWNPSAIVPRMTGVVAHEFGIKAAKWINDSFRNSDGGYRKNKTTKRITNDCNKTTFWKILYFILRKLIVIPVI